MKKTNKNDCRAINEDLMKALSTGGFKEFVNFVKKTEKEDLGYKLALCFRGNDNPDSVVIYYNNHMLWKLFINKESKLSVKISFNHARYTINWKEKYETLCSDKYNFKKKKIDENEEIYIGELTAISDNFDKEFVEGTFSIMKPLMDDFFNTQLKYDYFKNKQGNHKDYLEKKRQQELYIECNNLNNGLFIYDLEFAQPQTANTNKSNNQPDMLGIRFKDKKPEKLVLIEVKSKESAMRNDSGLIKHINGMESYLEDENAINNRILEANEILQQYKELGLRNIKQDFNFSNLPIEIRVILTDEAAEYFIRNKNYFEKRKNGDSSNLSKILLSRGYKIDVINSNRIEIYK